MAKGSSASNGGNCPNGQPQNGPPGNTNTPSNPMKDSQIANNGGPGKIDPKNYKDKQAIVASLQNRLFQTNLNMSQQEAVQQFLDSKTKMSDTDIAEAIRLMMSTPDYQVT